MTRSQYIRGLRNPAKRKYAEDYLLFLKGKGQTMDPTGTGLSYMAAQAVRLRLMSLTEQQSPDLGDIDPPPSHCPRCGSASTDCGCD